MKKTGIILWYCKDFDNKMFRYQLSLVGEESWKDIRVIKKRYLDKEKRDSYVPGEF